MSELEDKINSLLSSPDEMGRIVKLAQSFMSGDSDDGNDKGAKSDESPTGGLGGGISPDIMGAVSKLMGGFSQKAEEKQESGFDGFDPNIMKTVTRLMGGMTQKNDKTALVNAMVPHMSDERGKRLGRAVQMAKMLKMAGAVFSEYGGGDND